MALAIKYVCQPDGKQREKVRVTHGILLYYLIIQNNCNIYIYIYIYIHRHHPMYMLLFHFLQWLGTV